MLVRPASNQHPSFEPVYDLKSTFKWQMIQPMNLELTSERLRLSPLQPGDLDISLEMFTDPLVLQYARQPMTPDAIRNEMRNWLKRGGNGGIGIWCISDRVSDEKYGTVALLPLPLEGKQTDFSQVRPGHVPDGDVEVGYFLKRSAWRKGYATEACRRLLQFAFKEAGFDKIVATLEEENAASIKVLIKSGFINHGTMYCYGEQCPSYRITRDEWLKR
jgi:RimJ/RimL family protein N-acetyltransferase